MKTKIQSAIEKLESAVRWLQDNRHPNDVMIAQDKIHSALKLLDGDPRDPVKDET